MRFPHVIFMITYESREMYMIFLCKKKSTLYVEVFFFNIILHYLKESICSMMSLISWVCVGKTRDHS